MQPKRTLFFLTESHSVTAELIGPFILWISDFLSVLDNQGLCCLLPLSPKCT